ncbi:MAG: hypothetical protein HY202_07060 [Nitrospirae bacterium]|nr:hypothetical protein [Nitrospirota bacterium]
MIKLLKTKKLRSADEVRNGLSARVVCQVLFSAILLSMSLAFSADAADTATVSRTSQMHLQQGPSNPADPGPWGMDGAQMSSNTDPHPETVLPRSITGTTVDTQFGRDLPSGFSQIGLLDATTTSGIAGFQSVVTRMNSTASGTSRLNQLQTQIYQNQAAAGYIFDNKFGVNSMTDATGNLIGQAAGNFIQTRQEIVPGGTQTTTCAGTYTWDPDNGFTLTSGTAQGTGSRCTTK